MSRSLSSFSKNYLATTTDNNTIKIWKLPLNLDKSDDTLATLFTQFQEKNHLKIHYSTICVYESNNTNENNYRKDDSSNNNSPIVILGDKVGRIVIFNIGTNQKQLEISRSIESKDSKHVMGGHMSRVNSISMISNNSFISVSNDKTIKKWSLNGDLLMNSKLENDLIAFSYNFITFQNQCYNIIASNQINILNSNGKLVAKLSGHASQVRFLKVTSDNNYLISGGQDRFIYLWKLDSIWKDLNIISNSNSNLTSNKKIKPKKIEKLKKKLLNVTKNEKSKLALHTLALDDNVIGIDLLTIDNKYYIAAASRTKCYIFLFEPLIKNKNKNKSQMLDQSLEPIVVINCYNSNEKGRTYGDLSDLNYSYFRNIKLLNDKTLLVIRGNSSIVVLKRVIFGFTRIEDSNNNITFKNEITLERVMLTKGEEIKLIKNKNEMEIDSFEKQIETKEDVNMVVLDVSDSILPNPTNVKLMGNYESSNKIIGKKRSKQEMNEEEELIDSKNDTSMEPPTKKQKLNEESENVITTTANETFGEKLLFIEKTSNVGLNNGNNIPTASSLAQILSQSLLSNDQNMFESLLILNKSFENETMERQFINNTLDKINSKVAIVLLKRLSYKFRSKPRQSIDILKWLIPLLNRHSATFSNNIETRDDLQSIFQTIDYNISSIIPLFKLLGRINLLNNQIQKVKTHKSNINLNSEFENNIQKSIINAKNKPLFEHFDNLVTNKNKFNKKLKIKNKNKNSNKKNKNKKTSNKKNKKNAKQKIKNLKNLENSQEFLSLTPNSETESPNLTSNTKINGKKTNGILKSNGINEENTKNSMEIDNRTYDSDSDALSI